LRECSFWEIIAWMESRALAVLLLGGALIFGASAVAVADPPATTTATSTGSDAAAPPPAPDGQTVVIVGPFDSPAPPPKPQKHSTAAGRPPQDSPAVTAAPRRRAVSPPPVPQRVSPARKSDAHRSPPRGGPSRLVSPPTPRGGGSIVIAPPTAPLVTPVTVPATPHRSVRWWIPLMIAAGLLGFLLAVRLACRGWAARRSQREWTKHFDEVPGNTAVGPDPASRQRTHLRPSGDP
jgi:hypothetical protein